MEDYEILEWDSEFFKFQVVKVISNYLDDDAELKLKFLYEKGAELIYYTSGDSDFEEHNSNYYDIKLVSKRVPIIKKMTNLTKIHPNISLYNILPPDSKLIALARSAGRQGRFGKDSRISESIFNQIFENWIINSIKKIIADAVIVYKSDDEIVGFATIKIDGNKGYAPLLAVDRSFEGKGVSFALMRAIETLLVKNGCDYVMSGTQEINKKALATFSRYGLKPQTPEYIYHLWRKK